jgi:hypothetical protein
LVDTETELHGVERLQRREDGLAWPSRNPWPLEHLVPGVHQAGRGDAARAGESHHEQCREIQERDVEPRRVVPGNCPHRYDDGAIVRNQANTAERDVSNVSRDSHGAVEGTGQKQRHAQPAVG